MQSEQNDFVPVERRRRIYRLVSQKGSVKVTDLAEDFDVGLNTIRKDLEVLQQEGKLRRVHGGAVVKDSPMPLPPYAETVEAHIEEKSWIGMAAQDFIPSSGTIFIGSGSTVYQMVRALSPGMNSTVVTNSIQVAAYLLGNQISSVDVLGGPLKPELQAAELLERSVEGLYWDVAFMGVGAIDVNRGITTLNQSNANTDKRMIEHASKVIVLCDSSKIGRYSYVHVGPLALIDVLITDSNIDPQLVSNLEEQGLKVVVAGSSGSK